MNVDRRLRDKYVPDLLDVHAKWTPSCCYLQSLRLSSVISLGVCYSVEALSRRHGGLLFILLTSPGSHCSPVLLEIVSSAGIRSTHRGNKRVPSPRLLHIRRAIPTRLVRNIPTHRQYRMIARTEPRRDAPPRRPFVPNGCQGPKGGLAKSPIGKEATINPTWLSD